jgi:hypothetical protein
MSQQVVFQPLNQFFETLRIRVRTVIISLQLLETPQQNLVDDLSIIEKFRHMANVLSNQMKTRNKLIADLMKTLGLKVDSKIAVKMLVTWMDTDTNNLTPSHLFFLYMALWISKTWIEIIAINVNKRYALKFIDELLFSLTPHVNNYQIKDVFSLHQLVVDDQTVKEEIQLIMEREPQLFKDVTISLIEHSKEQKK